MIALAIGLRSACGCAEAEGTLYKLGVAPKLGRDDSLAVVSSEVWWTSGYHVQTHECQARLAAWDFVMTSRVGTVAKLSSADH